MPVIHYSRSIKRDIDPSMTFTIVFCSVAGTVVCACALWVLIIPAIQKKWPKKTSPPRWNEGSALTARPRAKSQTRSLFPPHPAVFPPITRPQVAQVLPRYDPRIESPFPNPPLNSCHNSSPHKLRTTSAPAPIQKISSSGGLFTPARKDAFASNATSHTFPRNKSRPDLAKSADFGDAREFILAVPEPLCFGPRMAGKAPPPKAVTTQEEPDIEMMPRSDSKELLHPNKLFRELTKSEVRSSNCSSTTMKVDHRSSDLVTARGDINDSPRVSNTEMESKDAQTPSLKAYQYAKHMTHSFRQDGESEINSSMKAMNRLRSYRLLTGAKPPSNMIRRGTFTRPKTPVDELRRRYDEQSYHNNTTALGLPHDMTMSTFASLAFEDCSDIHTVSTPATSPTLPPVNLEPSLRLRAATSQRKHLTQKEQVPPLPASSDFMERDAGSNNLWRPLQIEAGDYGQILNVRAPDIAKLRKSKPAPLIIKKSKSPVQRFEPIRSLSDGCEMSPPLPERSLARIRVRASSLYSRGTQGFSVLGTPQSPDFSSAVHDVWGGHDLPGEEPREFVKSRISEWTKRIEGLPKSSATDNFMNANEVVERRGVSHKTWAQAESTSVSNSDGRIVQATGNGPDTYLIPDCVHTPGSAPGGADWI